MSEIKWFNGKSNILTWQTFIAKVPSSQNMTQLPNHELQMTHYHPGVFRYHSCRPPLLLRHQTTYVPVLLPANKLTPRLATNYGSYV